MICSKSNETQLQNYYEGKKILTYYLSNGTLEGIWNLLFLLLKNINTTERSRHEHSTGKKNISKKDEEVEATE